MRVASKMIALSYFQVKCIYVPTNIINMNESSVFTLSREKYITDRTETLFLRIRSKTGLA